ncbi:MAG: hypothetical protein JXA06_08755 [Bacteroidetes bacterium]|nr:hypothetical protein [Bacteroidota bacterium]
MKTKLLIFILFLSSICLVYARQASERLIVNKFEQSLKELALFADSAKTVQDCVEINSMIDDIEIKYADKKDLLDRALYPDDYQKSIEKLRGRLLIRRNDLGVIETQYARIAELEAQVLVLSNKVDSLDRENDRLSSMIKRMTGKGSLVDSLRMVVNRLKQNLIKRDEVIFSLVDSLFLQYDKNVANMTDIEKQSMYGKLERKNVFTGLKKSIEDNLNFLRSTKLTPIDYVEIARQNSQFTSQWKGVGPKLADIYLSGKKKTEEIVLIDSLLNVWSGEVDRSNWGTLNSILIQNGVTLKAFNNSDEFTANFTSYIDEIIKNTAEDPEDVRAKQFNTFNDNVWKNNIKTTWLPVLLESGKLTQEQAAKIEEAVDNWESAVSPVSPIVYVGIAIVIIALIIGLAMGLRKKPEEEQA